jgi:hypothetical protein
MCKKVILSLCRFKTPKVHEKGPSAISWRRLQPKLLLRVRPSAHRSTTPTETQLYNTARVCFGLGGRRKHALQDNLILQARVLTLEGSSSTLGIDNTFGEVQPSLGRRRGPKISTPKDDVIATPGPSLPGSSSGIRPEQAARPVTPGPRPAVLQGRQPDPRPRLVNSGVGPANGRPDQAPANQVFFSSQLCLCSC